MFGAVRRVFVAHPELLPIAASPSFTIGVAERSFEGGLRLLLNGIACR